MPKQEAGEKVEVVGHVKITKPDGRVFHADIPAEDIVMYRMPDGSLSPVYPAGAVLGEAQED